jgi:WD40 repeat protein
MRRPFISPDGKQVTFGTNHGEIYVVSTGGGTPQRIVEKDAYDATWSPNGNLVVLTVFSGTSTALATYDFRSRKLSRLPLSEGLGWAQWLTQETLVAAVQNPTRLVSFDFKTQKRTELESEPAVNWAVSPDHKYLYYTTGGADPEARRIRLADHKVETIASLKGLRRVTDSEVGTQISVAADGSAVFSRDTGTQEIYALTLKWP